MNVLAHSSRTVKDLLNSSEFTKALMEVVPGAFKPRRFVRAALITMTRVPKLGECSRESFFQCMLDCAFYGLEPDRRRAHLIPFENKKMCRCGHEMDVHRLQECTKCDCRQRRVLVECTLIIDYKGLADLVRRSGEVSKIHADAVYPGDVFDAAHGSNAHLDHKLGEERTGKAKMFYSFVQFKDGSEDFIVMTRAEVDKVRARSKTPDAGPWVTDYDEMGKKTVFRRHTKWLPLSPDVKAQVAREDPDFDAVDVDAMLAEEPAKELPEPSPSRKDQLLKTVTTAREAITQGPPKETGK